MVSKQVIERVLLKQAEYKRRDKIKGEIKFLEGRQHIARFLVDKDSAIDIPRFSLKKAECKCNKCGTKKEVAYANLCKYGFVCDNCDFPKTKNPTKECFQNYVKTLNSDIEVIGEYINSKTIVKIKCNQCNNEYNVLPIIFVNKDKCKCKYCKESVRYYYPISKTNPELVKFLENKENGEKYTIGTHTRLWFKCMNCGYKILEYPKVFSHNGFICRCCNDGISYPNKFLRSLLREISKRDGIEYDYQFEYNIKGTASKYYDGYFKYNGERYLVEMHGDQHYRDAWGDVKTVRENDLLKEKIAYDNGYKLISIDCKKSDFNYIKNMVKKSELNNIFNITEEEFIQVGRLCEKSCVKEASELYNNGYTIKQIEDEMKICKTSVKNYLVRASKIGWINDYIQDGKLVGGNKRRQVEVVILDKDKKEINRFESFKKALEWIKGNLGVTTKSQYITRHAENNTEYLGYYFKIYNRKNIQK